MTSSDERPPNFRRRLFWLAAFFVVLFGHLQCRLVLSGWPRQERSRQGGGGAQRQRHRGRLRQSCSQRLSAQLRRLLRQPGLPGRHQEHRRVGRQLQCRRADHATSFADCRPSGATANLGAWHGAAVDRLGQFAGQRQTVLAMAPARFAGGRRPVRPDRPGGRNRPGRAVQCREGGGATASERPGPRLYGQFRRSRNRPRRDCRTRAAARSTAAATRH